MKKLKSKKKYKYKKYKKQTQSYNLSPCPDFADLTGLFISSGVNNKRESRLGFWSPNKL